MKNKICTLLGVIIGTVALAGTVALSIEYKNYIEGTPNFTINTNSLDGYNIRNLDEYIKTYENVHMGELDMTEAITACAYTDGFKNFSFMDYIQARNKDYTVPIEYKVDLVKLGDLIRAYNKDAIEPVSASIKTENNKFVVIEEKMGTKLDKMMIMNSIDYLLEKGNIDVNEYYVKPSITADKLNERVKDANEKLEWKLEYENGMSFYIPIEYMELRTNGSYKIDYSFVDAIIDELEGYYDTVGQAVTFETSNGDTVEISGGTWGTLMDSAQEKEYILDLAKNGISEENRKPIMKREYTEIGDTYIEVDIEGQYVWVYKDGEILMETECVTGDTYKNRNTPTGVYFISEKINGKYLRGVGYKTWVNKWMRLTNGGIGLHDAYWRGSFGKSIYKGNGSHGCINLPKSFAYDLYEEAYVGMPVIIY